MLRWRGLLQAVPRDVRVRDFGLCFKSWNMAFCMPVSCSRASLSSEMLLLLLTIPVSRIRPSRRTTLLKELRILPAL